MHGQIVAMNCLMSSSNKYAKRPRIASKKGVIKAMGGEGEESREGKGFTEG